MAGGVILGITGSFTGVDASGRLKQATLRLGGKPSGGGKPSSGDAGTGKASGSGVVQLGYGTGKPQAGKKHRVFDEGGHWLGLCYCGVRAKVGRQRCFGSERAEWAGECAVWAPPACRSLQTARCACAAPCTHAPSTLPTSTVQKRTVKKPGPNNGKEFWSCGRYTQVSQRAAGLAWAAGSGAARALHCWAMRRLQATALKVSAHLHLNRR